MGEESTSSLPPPETAMTEILADVNKNGGIVNYFAGNVVAANLMMALMLIGGAISVVSLNTQLFPNIEPGAITVSVPYPGATPAETSEAVLRYYVQRS